ncbi:MAG TPA: flotillin family protein, partial [Lacipirellulaceae bacterium]|nr:flotillin family protein [Lacipirellulaceae bacterium]
MSTNLPLALLDSMSAETLFWLAVLAAFVGMVFFSTVVLLKTNYKRCSSNQVLVIFGKTAHGQAAKTVHGGASFVWPLFQDYRYLSLEPIQIEIPLRGALSIENIRVNVPSVFTVAIGTQPDVMTNAAIRLLDLTVVDIRKQAEEIIFGQLRQVIASMGIEDINRNRDTFLEHIQNSVEPELKKIGLVLINV